MSGEAPKSAQDIHKLLSNVFHLISQPMTALQCSLEFALNTLEDSQQCRPWLEAALENSERLRCRLSLAREIADAAELGSCTETVELRSLLQEALSEIRPLFESAGATPKLRCDEIEVSGEHSRLLRALLRVLQNLGPSGVSAPEAPEISVGRESELIEVRFSRFVLRRDANKDQVASQLEIAKEIFESVGGGLIFYCFAGNDALVRVLLPTPHAQLTLYQDARRKKPASGLIGTNAVFPYVS